MVAVMPRGDRAGLKRGEIAGGGGGLKLAGEIVEQSRGPGVGLLAGGGAEFRSGVGQDLLEFGGIRCLELLQILEQLRALREVDAVGGGRRSRR